MSVTAGEAASIHRDYNRGLRHSVAIAAFAGRDQYGDPTHAAPLAYAADVVFRQRQIVNTAGEQIASSGSASLAFNADGSAPTVTDDDLLTLPDGTTPRILAVERDPGNPAIGPTILYF